MSQPDPWSLALEGTSLIEASAGTGKTFALTTLYLRLLVEQDLAPAEILVVTYTQAATAELRERVRERIREAIALRESSGAGLEEEQVRLRALALDARRRAEESGGPDALRRALREFDEAAIFTIHGFCQRSLERNAFESGAAFDAELVEAADGLGHTLARDLWAGALAGADADFVEWLLEGGGRRWQLTPDELKRGLLDRLGADEEMPVLPAPEALEAAMDDVAERCGARDRDRMAWARAWREGRERVLPWLLESDAPSRGIYKKKTLEQTWIPRLDDWSDSLIEPDAGSPPLCFALPDWWPKLGPERLASGVKKGYEPLEDPVFEAFEAVWHSTCAVEATYDARALALRRSMVESAREEARRRRDERHQLVFDDLLVALRDALRAPEGGRLADRLREQFRFALIDEFQDTDPVQYEIFRRVWHREAAGEPGSPPRGLILIGDPKQAIYSFRGADVHTYLAARQDAADASCRLDVNWRSAPPLIHAVNTIFARPERPFAVDEIDFHPVEPRTPPVAGLESAERSTAGLRVLLAEREEDQKEWSQRQGRTRGMHAIAVDIAALLESDARIGDRPVAASDVAVLCRTHREMARVRRALEALGIPCVDRGEGNVFDTREAWELLCVLEAWLHPGDPSRVRAALATGAHGLDAARLAPLAADAASLAEVSERFAECNRLWQRSGFMRAFEHWRGSEGVTPRLLAWIDGERRLVNWLHLAELLQSFEAERGLSPSGLRGWLERAIADPDVRAALGKDASLLRLERDDQAVSLVTLHRSKGLEYEIVYLPCLWERVESRLPARDKVEKGEGRRPPLRCHDPARGRRILDLGGPDYLEHYDRQKEEELAEQLRLLYVGLTRARRQCVLLWGAIGPGAYASTPMARLLRAPEWEREGETPKELVKEIRSWDDARWRAVWERIGEGRGEGVVSVEPADWAPRERWRPRRSAAPELGFEAPGRPLPRPRLTTSFSGLVRGAERARAVVTGPEALGRDLDVVTDPRPAVEDLGGDLAAAMHTFPRGAQAGTLLHEVLEQVDFSAPDDANVERLAREALGRVDLDPRHAEQIRHVVRSVAETPLRREPTPLRLADIGPEHWRAELEFTLAAPGGAAGDRLDPAGLQRLLSKADPDSPSGRYAERAGQLGWPRFEGHLRGFIDAVFCDSERYYLIDYKSNDLGPRQSDYRAERLVETMIEHDYVLQFLIYSVALDRHLAARLSDYDVDRHFGGVYYLFLRGLAPEHEPGCGVFFDRPESALLRALSESLGGAPGAGS